MFQISNNCSLLYRAPKWTHSDHRRRHRKKYSQILLKQSKIHWDTTSFRFHSLDETNSENFIMKIFQLKKSAPLSLCSSQCSFKVKYSLWITNWNENKQHLFCISACWEKFWFLFLYRSPSLYSFHFFPRYFSILNSTLHYFTHQTQQ